jgi:hypothetical protein
LLTHIRTYSLSGSGRLNTDNKLTLYKALIKSVMTYASPIWEYDYAANAHLIKLQRLQNRVLRTTGDISPRIARGFQNF